LVHEAKAFAATAVRRDRLAPSRWATRPAVVYLIVTTQIPFVATLYFSLHSWNLLYPARPVRYVGLANYSHVFADRVFQIAIENTVLFTVLSALLSTLIGLGLALLVNRLSFGRGLAYSLLFAPFLIMETVNPIIWKNMLLNPVYGLLDFALTSLGLHPVDLITNAPRSAIVLMIVWQWAPFMMLILLAGLQSVAQELLEAAQMDGANAWSQFRYITLPHLAPYLSVGMMLEAILLLPAFGPIYVGTYGGPGNQTANLMFAVYRILTEQYEIGRAAAGGVITALMTTVVALALLAYVRPYMERR
jgi:sorbitol/mannitol transport system permease protein